ncbi:hemolysin XhlA family protein [Dehalobacter sp. DCM]|uniref:hemolysin XhlA family protein n=1 Tax=Dehalobacter sp. DCM TaxID=2907827 RepID=UPI0030820D8D|nr:hemolysin XhlA family protein [Dehalobacter sp. DCM]
MENDKVYDILLEVKSDVAEIKGQLNTYNTLQENVSDLGVCLKETEARSKSNTKRIDSIEDNNKWLWRTVAGTIIAGVIGVLIAAYK